ncbi:MAG: flagellar biosynthetic protein FliO [Clostridium sp.]
MMSDVFTTAGMLLLMAGIIAAAWGASRFLGRKFGVPSSGKKIQVLEQVPLGTDRSLLLVRCGGRIYLLGSSQAGIHMIDRIEESKVTEKEECGDE